MTDTCSCPKVGCGEKRMRKFSFICLDSDCMKDGYSPCIIELYAENEPDFPSYCPWEITPTEYKYKAWAQIKL